ncbi:MAG TPA: hypothetical protein VFS94_03645, partial [Gemmatimonadales bacterium]|nr:hypothetical protein [Gemmatimonadales bacterium]
MVEPLYELVRELDVLIRARYPLIAVSTFEELRFQRLMLAVAQLERTHPVRLGQRPGIGVTEVDDVAEHLIERAGIPLLLAGRLADEVFQFGDQRLELLVGRWLGE